MFRFADPNFLYLLILLPFLVALYLYSNITAAKIFENMVIRHC